MHDEVQGVHDGVHDEVQGTITGRCKSHRLEGVQLEMRHQTLPDQKKEKGLNLGEREK